MNTAVLGLIRWTAKGICQEGVEEVFLDFLAVPGEKNSFTWSMTDFWVVDVLETVALSCWDVVAVTLVLGFDGGVARVCLFISQLARSKTRARRGSICFIRFP